MNVGADRTCEEFDCSSKKKADYDKDGSTSLSMQNAVTEALVNEDDDSIYENVDVSGNLKYTQPMMKEPGNVGSKLPLYSQGPEEDEEIYENAIAI